MNQEFKKWIIGKIDEEFRDEARIQFFSMIKHESEKVKTYIRDRLSKFVSLYEKETHNMFIPIPDKDTNEIFEGLLVHFKDELLLIP